MDSPWTEEEIVEAWEGIKIWMLQGKAFEKSTISDGTSDTSTLDKLSNITNKE